MIKPMVLPDLDTDTANFDTQGMYSLGTNRWSNPHFLLQDRLPPMCAYGQARITPAAAKLLPEYATLQTMVGEYVKGT